MCFFGLQFVVEDSLRQKCFRKVFLNENRSVLKDLFGIAQLRGCCQSGLLPASLWLVCEGTGRRGRQRELSGKKSFYFAPVLWFRNFWGWWLIIVFLAKTAWIKENEKGHDKWNGSGRGEVFFKVSYFLIWCPLLFLDFWLFLHAFGLWLLAFACFSLLLHAFGLLLIVFACLVYQINHHTSNQIFYSHSATNAFEPDISSTDVRPMLTESPNKNNIQQVSVT